MEVQDEVSTRFKLVLFAFGIVLVGALGYFVFQQNTDFSAYEDGSGVVHKTTLQAAQQFE